MEQVRRLLRLRPVKYWSDDPRPGRPGRSRMSKSELSRLFASDLDAARDTLPRRFHRGRDTRARVV